ncbi:GntR family transcriptional regulator [Pseudomonas putida]|uniref:GntR family transcriptional regulator n=1 Tax=Pseudomonas putida TaxID=303 RepID=A0A7Y7ZCX3_PSEPU|nr:GntR family transcriptional regulator [Pseudomonas putida]
MEPGSKLVIDALAGRYATSATPLREALNRLIADGLGWSRSGSCADSSLRRSANRIWSKSPSHAAGSKRSPCANRSCAGTVNGKKSW